MAGQGVSQHRQFQFQILGGFYATHDGIPITGLDKARLQSFIAYLLLHDESPVSRQQVAYALWPETSDQQARTNLRTLLSRFQKVLTSTPPLLHVTRQAIQLHADADVTTDLYAFELALLSAESAPDATTQTRALQKAIRVYHGDLLPDCYDEWIPS